MYRRIKSEREGMRKTVARLEQPASFPVRPIQRHIDLHHAARFGVSIRRDEREKVRFYLPVGRLLTAHPSGNH